MVRPVLPLKPKLKLKEVPLSVLMDPDHSAQIRLSQHVQQVPHLIRQRNLQFAQMVNHKDVQIRSHQISVRMVLIQQMLPKKNQLKEVQLCAMMVKHQPALIKKHQAHAQLEPLKELHQNVPMVQSHYAQTKRSHQLVLMAPQPENLLKKLLLSRIHLELREK